MSGFSRVSIPPNLRKTIHDIKEITGKHSDEDVYAMLKECNMDPNETAQRLLYLDTFHEVKRKRDRRKVSSNNRTLEENRGISSMQKRGTRVGNYYSYNSDEGVGGKRLDGQKQNDYSKATWRASKPIATAPHKAKKTLSVVASSAVRAEDLRSTCDDNYSHESTFPLIEDNVRGLNEDANDGYGNESKKLALRPLILQKQLSMLCPGPTPTLTPTNPSKVVTKARNRSGSLKGNSSCLGNSVVSSTVSGLHYSASDPANIIMSEAENQLDTAEISSNLLADSRMHAVQNVTSGRVVSGSVNLTANSLPKDYQGVERSWGAESSPNPSSTSCLIAAGTGVALDDDPHSHPILEGSSGITTSKIQVKMHKLHISISEGQSVIFPNHLHVPEALKTGLTFGSLDVPAQFNNDDSNPKDVSAPTNVQAPVEPSSNHQFPFPESGGNDCPDHVQSPAQVVVNLTASKENASSGNAPRNDQSKQDMLQPLARSHTPFLTSVPDHSQNHVPPIAGSRALKRHGREQQQIPSKSSSTPSMAQPRGIPQRSIAVPPPLFPLLRQSPYPPNYISYSPYFSQLYMPSQNAQQLLAHSGFPQQPSPGNIYMPPTATATSGVKFPVYKPGMHFGISSCYGSFGASGLSYGPHGANGNNSIARSELNDKDMYSSFKQSEELHVLNSVPGQDVSALQANVFYNLPRGQPVPAAFPSAQVGHNSIPGSYHPHPSQSMSTPSLQSLQPPPQPTAGAAEPYLVVSRRHTHG